MPKIDIDDIANPLPDRNVSPQLVQDLAGSMAEIGLLHPIAVTPDQRLVAGRQRLAAAKLLGWTEIDATIVTGFTEAELATLDENLFRGELTHLEHAETLGKRREIHNRLHPDTVAGSSELMARIRRDEPASGPAFVDDMVERTGQSRSKLDRLLRIATGLEPEVRDLLRHTPIADRLTDLRELVELDPQRRREIVQRVHDDPQIKRLADVTDETVRDATPGLVLPERAIGADAVNAGPNSRSLALSRAVAAACRERGIDCEALGLGVDVDPDGKSFVRVALPAPVANPQLLTAVRVIGELAAKIDRVHDIAAETAVEPAEWRQLASPADMADVPANQMQAEWVDASRVRVSRGGVPLSEIPAKRAAKSGTFVKPAGNTKSIDTVSILNDAAQGCLRGGTGFAKCGHACYVIDGKPGTGCFAATNQYTIHEDIIGRFDISCNGWTNDLLTLRLPADGIFVLKADPVWGPIGRRIWREASESSDSSLSISLGMLQMWGEHNPEHLVFGISSNYFRPSDQMLRWLAALENTWVLHSVSPWFDRQEQDSRFAAIARFLEFGVPTGISIVTSPDFVGNDAIAERALKLVGPEQIIEAPHQIGKHFKHLPLLHINPLGSCGENRYDRDGYLVHGEYTGNGKIRYYRLDGSTKVHARGFARPRCAGCRLLCGAMALGFAGGTTSLEAARDVDAARVA